MRIQEHQFPDLDSPNPTCMHCHALKAQIDRVCIVREVPTPPRPRPASFMDDLGAIGDIMKKIRADEDNARNTTGDEK